MLFIQFIEFYSDDARMYLCAVVERIFELVNIKYIHRIEITGREIYSFYNISQFGKLLRGTN